MSQTRGGSRVGTVVAVGLLVLAIGSTVYFAVGQQRMARANEALAADYSALRQERDEKLATIEALSAERQSNQAEIGRLHRSAEETAAAAAILREQVAALDHRGATLQEEIAKARSEGTLKEGRIEELTRLLSQTKESADKAQNQLRALGYTKDELNDQVAKLQNRLGDSQNELIAAQRLNAERERAVAALQADLTTTRGETAALRSNAEALKRELDRRPRPSVPLEADIYRPSRDNKPKQDAGK